MEKPGEDYEKIYSMSNTKAFLRNKLTISQTHKQGHKVEIHTSGSNAASLYKDRSTNHSLNRGGASEQTTTNKGTNDWLASMEGRETISGFKRIRV